MEIVMRRRALATSNFERRARGGEAIEGIGRSRPIVRYELENVDDPDGTTEAPVH
jgi:hypothetical protein